MNTITESLAGKKILVTGATGFLGQPLVEKILWAAPDVAKVYVLVRPKRQFGGRLLSAQERLEKELYASSVFERLQTKYQADLNSFLRTKLVAVAGDISRENLGIEVGEFERLRREIDIVINSAAVVSFDARLDEALSLNVFGAKRLTQFAAICKKAVLIHVSTAYVCGAADGLVPETNYHAQLDGDPENAPARRFTDIDREIGQIEEIIEEIFSRSEAREFRRELNQTFLKKFRKEKRRKRLKRHREIQRLKERWLRDQLASRGMSWARSRGWNDTYTYTKALGEQMVYRHRNGVPTAIIRPSIIESSLAEPVPGWLDGLRMADPLIVAIGKGRLRSLPLNPDVNLDLVPVDMVVNAMLAVLPKLEDSPRDSEIEIFQVATSSKNPVALRELKELIHEYFTKNPMLDKEGNPIRIKPLRFPKPAAFRLQHKLKSVPLDTAERTLKRLPSTDATQKAKRRVTATKAAHERLYYYGELYEPYLNLTCSFEVKRTLSLYESLSEDEREEFNFNVGCLNWRHYIQNVHIPGVKKHILKIEGLGTLEVGEKLPADGPTPNTIIELLRLSAERFQEKTAVQIKRNQHWERFSFKDLLRKAERIAQYLKQLGLKKGDRVVLFSENQPEWGMAYFGSIFAGLTVVPIDSQTWYREMWSVQNYTGSKAVLLSEKCFAKLPKEGLEKNEGSEIPALLLDVGRECKPFPLEGFPHSCPKKEFKEDVVELTEVTPDDAASIIFTTGTAVDPRGAVHTHRSFLNNLRGVNHYLSVSESDQLLSVLPLYHALEFSCGFLMPIHRGATVTYASSLKPKALLQTMRETGTTCLLGVPTLFNLIKEDVERRILGASKSVIKTSLVKRSKQLSRSVERRLGHNIGKRLFAQVHRQFGGKIRVFVSGGSRLGRTLYRDFKAMGMPIYEGYGLTETAPVLTVNPLHRSREGSAGMPLPGVEMRLFQPDEDGIGEIIVRSPSLMKEYYLNAAATSSVMRAGWFHTGDLGWVDADGYIYITGRKKDVIVTGAGKNVYPTDLEAIYRTNRSIEEICVVGIRKGLTEDVHAAIVPHQKTAALSAEEKKKLIQGEVQELARELPSYHRLQSIHIWPEKLPRDKAGELDRQAIRTRILERIGQARPPADQVRKARPESLVKEPVIKELARLAGMPEEEITEGTNLYSDLGLDSLMALELLLFLESHFKTTVPDEQVVNFQTVGDILDELRRTGLKEEEFTPREPLDMVRSTLPYAERPMADRGVMTASFAGMQSFLKRYFGFRLRNQEMLPTKGPYIIAANHSSHLDTPAMISAVSMALGRRQAQSLHVIGARDYFFNSPFKSWLFSTCLNVVPIERDEISLAGLRQIRTILARGEPVLIFPEGTRSRSGALQDFKPGIGLIAYDTNTPIVPAYIKGTHAALPPGRSLPKRVEITVSFGPQVVMDPYRTDAENGPRDEVYRRITEDVREAVRSLAGDAGLVGEREGTRCQERS